MKAKEFYKGDKKLTIQEIINQKNVNWQKLSKADLSVEVLLHFKDKVIWNIYFLNNKITNELFDLFEDYIDWDFISRNKKLTTEDLAGEFQSYYNFSILSKYRKFTSDELIKFKDLIDWDLASRYQRITTKNMVLLEKYINLNVAAEYQKLTEEVIEKYKKSLNWTIVCRHQKLSKKTLKSNNFYLDYSELSRYIDLKKNIKFIVDSYWKFNWTILCSREDMAFEFIEKFKDYRCLKWRLISRFCNFNSNIEIVKKYKDRIDWDTFSKYQLIDKESFIKFKKYINIDLLHN